MWLTDVWNQSGQCLFHLKDYNGGSTSMLLTRFFCIRFHTPFPVRIFQANRQKVAVSSSPASDSLFFIGSLYSSNFSLISRTKQIFCLFSTSYQHRRFSFFTFTVTSLISTSLGFYCLHSHNFCGIVLLLLLSSSLLLLLAVWLSIFHSTKQSRRKITKT